MLNMGPRRLVLALAFGLVVRVRGNDLSSRRHHNNSSTLDSVDAPAGILIQPPPSSALCERHSLVMYVVNDLRLEHWPVTLRISAAVPQVQSYRITANPYTMDGYKATANSHTMDRHRRSWSSLQPTKFDRNRDGDETLYPSSESSENSPTLLNVTTSLCLTSRMSLLQLQTSVTTASIPAQNSQVITIEEQATRLQPRDVTSWDRSISACMAQYTVPLTQAIIVTNSDAYEQALMGIYGSHRGYPTSKSTSTLTGTHWGISDLNPTARRGECSDLVSCRDHCKRRVDSEKKWHYGILGFVIAIASIALLFALISRLRRKGLLKRRAGKGRDASEAQSGIEPVPGNAAGTGGISLPPYRRFSSPSIDHKSPTDERLSSSSKHKRRQSANDLSSTRFRKDSGIDSRPGHLFAPSATAGSGDFNSEVISPHNQKDSEPFVSRYGSADAVTHNDQNPSQPRNAEESGTSPHIGRQQEGAGTGSDREASGSLRKRQQVERNENR